MDFIRNLKDRAEANKRMVSHLQKFRKLTSNKNYKEVLLCQIKNQSKDRLAKYTLGSVGTCHLYNDGTPEKSLSSLLVKHLKYKRMKFLRQLEEWLNGRKTYLAAMMLAVYGLVKAFGWNVTPEQDMAMLAFIGTLFGVGIGHKLDKIK